jgi:cytochrome c553
VRRHLDVLVAGLVCFVLGAVAQRIYDARRQAAPAPPPTARTAAPGPGSEHSAAPAAPIAFEREPLWAYGFERPPKPGEVASPQTPPARRLRPNEDPAEQTRVRHLEGSRAAYSLVDIRDGQNVVDWFPGDHPSMPAIIAHGPASLGRSTWGCASCHLPNGKGRPENAPPAGLPYTYIVRQLQDFRNGLRRSADPRKPNTNTMIALAKAMSDDEVHAAATYFASLPWTAWIRVVETDLVPKTRISGNLFLARDHTLSEPIGARIIEVPEDEEQAELYRNPHSGFVAYVPKGSIEKGRDLVTTGGMRIVDGRIIQGKTTACGTCHGPDLAGIADVPPIAGRSPSYIVRQLWDIQQGTRNGASAQLMKLVVANLSGDDLIAIAAYLASRVPPPATPAPAGSVAALATAR